MPTTLSLRRLDGNARDCVKDCGPFPFQERALCPEPREPAGQNQHGCETNCAQHSANAQRAVEWFGPRAGTVAPNECEEVRQVRNEERQHDERYACTAR